MEGKLSRLVRTGRDYKCIYCGDKFRLKATLLTHSCIEKREAESLPVFNKTNKGLKRC